MNDKKATEPGEQSPNQASIAPIVMSVSSEDLAAALSGWHSLRESLIVALPDCVLNLRGKQFLRKPFWRAVTTAYNLSVGEVREEKCKGDKDWGYTVLYRATAPNGRFADGDGACFASEKTGSMRTAHNVRAHAHTRAYNRAVSNLVGFGEVSADELTDQAIKEMRGGAQNAQKPPGKIQDNFDERPLARREPARTTPVHATPNYEVRCPECGAPMWDQRHQRDQDKRDKEAGTRAKGARPAWKCSDNKDHKHWSDTDRLKHEADNKRGPAASSVDEHDVTDRYNESGPEYDQVAAEDIF